MTVFLVADITSNRGRPLGLTPLEFPIFVIGYEKREYFAQNLNFMFPAPH